MDIYEFDAFICYSPDNDFHRLWVRHNLTYKLENEAQFTIVDPERDFPLGQNNVHNTEDYMDRSRHLIVVVSDLALDDSFFRYQIESAHARAQERNKHLFIITFEELAKPIANATVRVLLRDHIRLKWSHQRTGQIRFWERLSQHLDGAEEVCECCSLVCKIPGHSRHISRRE